LQKNSTWHVLAGVIEPSACTHTSRPKKIGGWSRTRSSARRSTYFRKRTWWLALRQKAAILQSTRKLPDRFRYPQLRHLRSFRTFTLFQLAEHGSTGLNYFRWLPSRVYGVTKSNSRIVSCVTKLSRKVLNSGEDRTVMAATARLSKSDRVTGCKMRTPSSIRTPKPI
jgi:hypothetical protein